MKNLFENNGAEFSECGKYRYKLWRIWDENKPLIMFIGLNPSTANASDNDPTIRRVISFAKQWGYGGVYMMNLFTIISADPSILSGNDKWGDFIEDKQRLIDVAKKCKKIVFAWGNFKEAQGRAYEVIKKTKVAYCLGKNKNGSPKHPLYIAANTELVTFK